LRAGGVVGIYRAAAGRLHIDYLRTTKQKGENVLLEASTKRDERNCLSISGGPREQIYPCVSTQEISKFRVRPKFSFKLLEPPL
jgi:hypothetical protein